LPDALVDRESGEHPVEKRRVDVLRACLLRLVVASREREHAHKQREKGQA
jgi:hypothetical protein